MLGILGWIVNILGLVCFIIVLIKQFQNAGVVHGIIGIITCGIWTFIWGWMNATKLNLKNIMMIWTVIVIACLVLGFMGGFNFSIGNMTTP
jgi:hypothetical protein